MSAVQKQGFYLYFQFGNRRSFQSEAPTEGSASCRGCCVDNGDVAEESWRPVTDHFLRWAAGGVCAVRPGVAMSVACGTWLTSAATLCV